MTGKAIRIIRQYTPSFILFLIVCGCRLEHEGLPAYIQPGLLYLKDAPYASLYIEVDGVEGAEVPEHWLDELRTFLSQYCHKPDAITIVRDPPIPLSDVQDLPVTMAAILYTDGPRTDGTRQPAYLHVFFYDLKKGLRAPTKCPHTLAYCPTTIFFNTHYIHIAPDYVRLDMLRHEAGHILGLGNERRHGDGSHCRNYGCLMRQSSEMLTDLAQMLGCLVGARVGERRLCADCRYDLESSQNMDPNDRQSFAGPFLMRREEGYYVARAPNCDFVGIAGETAFDWRTALDRVKGEIKRQIERHRKGATGTQGNPTKVVMDAGRRKGPGADVGPYVLYTLGPDQEPIGASDMEQRRTLLTTLLHDPCPVVQGIARQALRRTEAGVKTNTGSTYPEDYN